MRDEPPSAARAERLTMGRPAPEFSATSLSGEALRVPASPPDTPPAWTLVSFLRYASCPMCNLRMRELAAALPLLRENGVTLIAVLHSPERRARRFVPAALASHVVADPARRLYRRYAVSPSWIRLLWSVLMPSFYVAWARAMYLGFWGGWVDGPFATMPADFLVGPDGHVRVAHYGGHLGDHLAVAPDSPLWDVLRASS